MKLENALRKVEGKREPRQMRGVDFIYLINLDQRPEKLKRSLDQLSPYFIHPHRFAAIYGWELPLQILDHVGVRLEPGMLSGANKALGAKRSPRDTEPFVLDATCLGEIFYHANMSPGGLGCVLSHLSILQDAYDAGYETIWVLEDDFTVSQNPHILSEAIEQLDRVAPDWDLLFTDNNQDTVFPLWAAHAMWRPDLPDKNMLEVFQHYLIGSDFICVGGRTQAHSILYRRAGIEKILRFLKTRGVFLPYDIETAFIPHLKMVNFRKDVVWWPGAGPSDTLYHHFKKRLG